MLVLVPVATDGNANPCQKFMFNEKKTLSASCLITVAAK